MKVDILQWHYLKNNRNSIGLEPKLYIKNHMSSNPIKIQPKTVKL